MELFSYVFSFSQDLALSIPMLVKLYPSNLHSFVIHRESPLDSILQHPWSSGLTTLIEVLQAMNRRGLLIFLYQYSRCSSWEHWELGSSAECHWTLCKYSCIAYLSVPNMNVWTRDTTSIRRRRADFVLSECERKMATVPRHRGWIQR